MPSPHPTLAARLRHQMATEQRSLAYLLSGTPFVRRWHRLCRNLLEWRTLRHHAGPRAMADALVAAAFAEPQPHRAAHRTPLRPRTTGGIQI